MKPIETSVLPPIDADPIPRTDSNVVERVLFPVVGRRCCPPVIEPDSSTPFADVFESRRSVRSLHFAPLREILNAIAFATRPRAELGHDLHGRSQRPTISAGALHPIETVVFDDRTRARLLRYDPQRHQVELLKIERYDAIENFQAALGAILPGARATSLIFVGDFRKIHSVYESPMSLLWRDAGALLQTLALTATVYRLGFCPIGILGHEILEALNLDASRTKALGCALIGRSRY